MKIKEFKPPSKKKIRLRHEPKKRRYKYTTLDSLEKMYETVPEVPLPEGEYLLNLFGIKERAFKVLQDKLSMKTAKNPRKKPRYRIGLTGYQAFAEYNHAEFYNIPVPYSHTFLAEAWSCCPHKNYWEYYAHVYNARKPPIDFSTWLMRCQKGDVFPMITKTKAVQQSDSSAV